MINTEVLNEYFIWEENNSTEPQKNCENNNESVHYDTTTEIKTDSTLKDWRDITDPKLRRKMYKKYWKSINSDKVKASAKRYTEKHKQELKIKRESWRKKNLDKIKLKRQIKWKMISKETKEKYKTKFRQWRIKNLEHARKMERIYARRKIEKNKNNPLFKLKMNLRGRLYHAIKDNQKSGSAVDDLGCTIMEFKLYLESKFQPGMTWDNWSKYGWHIDHIKPLSSFDLTDRKQLLEACHYTNLQPLWAKDNLIKSNN